MENNENETNNITEKWYFDSSAFIISAIATVLYFLGSIQKGIGYFFYSILFFIFFYVGAYIGNVLRKIAKPDMFLSSGMMETLQIKLFWAIGPQIVGGIIAMFILGGIFPGVYK